MIKKSRIHRHFSPQIIKIPPKPISCDDEQRVCSCESTAAIIFLSIIKYASHTRAANIFISIYENPKLSVTCSLSYYCIFCANALQASYKLIKFKRDKKSQLRVAAGVNHFRFGGSWRAARSLSLISRQNLFCGSVWCEINCDTENPESIVMDSQSNALYDNPSFPKPSPHGMLELSFNATHANNKPKTPKGGHVPSTTSSHAASPSGRKFVIMHGDSKKALDASTTSPFLSPSSSFVKSKQHQSSKSLRLGRSNQLKCKNVA